MLSEVLLVFFIRSYMMYFYSLTKKGIRDVVQYSNDELNKLRGISVKTMEEQKRFLELRYPPSNWSFKPSWGMLKYFVIHIIIFLILYKLVIMFFLWIGFDLQLWHSILVLILGPIIINLLLQRFKLQKPSDITVFFK